jgi:hypothetical protein
MRAYEEVVNKVANTLVMAGIDRDQPFGFYLTNQQLAFLFDREPEVVEMDVQMAKDTVFNRLTRSFA